MRKGDSVTTQPSDWAVELLPCPFCGYAEVQVEQPSPHRFHVYCNQAEGGCGVEGPLRSTCEAAITAWSRRAPVARELDASATTNSAQISSSLVVGDAGDDGYYLASFKRSHDRGCVVWWMPNDSGYTTDLEQAGIYTEIKKGYHDSEYTVPVPVSFVRGLRVRRMVDVGDSLNRALWTAESLRAAMGAVGAGGGE